MTNFINYVTPGFMQEVTTDHNAAEVAELLTAVQNLDPATTTHLGAYLGAYDEYDGNIRQVKDRNSDDLVVVIVARFPHWVPEAGNRVVEISEQVRTETSERKRLAEIAEIEEAMAITATQQEARQARLDALRNK